MNLSYLMSKLQELKNKVYVEPSIVVDRVYYVELIKLSISNTKEFTEDELLYYIYA